MKRIGIILILLILMNFVSAIDIVEIEGDEYYQTDTIDTRDIQLIQRIASLENKLGNLTTKQDLTTSTTFIYNELYKSFRDKTDFLILTSVMINLFTVGLAFGLYFILKARRRI